MKFYSITEYAKLRGVSRQAVLKWVNNGKVKAVKIGRFYAIPAKAKRLNRL